MKTTTSKDLEIGTATIAQAPAPEITIIQGLAPVIMIM